MDNKNTASTELMFRIVIYIAGIFMVSLGIVLCKKCNMGVTPVSSIAYVLEYIIPLSFGTLMMFFYLINIIFEMILAKKIFDVKILLQIPVAVLLGRVTDFFDALINFDGTILLYQMISLALSVSFVAAGMLGMVSTNLVPNPPDGLVRQISQKLGKELGRIKIIYDTTCAALSAIISLAFLGGIKGLGFATVVSAVFVGKIATWIKMAVKKLQKNA